MFVFTCYCNIVFCNTMSVALTRNINSLAQASLHIELLMQNCMCMVFLCGDCDLIELQDVTSHCLSSEFMAFATLHGYSLACRVQEIC